MIDFISWKVISAVGATVAEYAFGKMGDKYCDTFLAKHKIKRILKEDKKFISKQFEEKERELLEIFLFQNIYQDSVFLYPVSNIPGDRAKLLWEKFCRYVEDNSHCINVSLEAIYRSKLEACVNNHNGLVNKYLLDESDRIILKTMQKNQSDLLGYIGKTLDSNSELQFENDMLDYTHKQIEGILHALRMDMRHYKFLLMLSTIGVLILLFVLIIVFPQIVDMLSGLFYEDIDVVTFSMVIFVVAFMLFVFIFWILLFLFKSNLSNLQKCEKRISVYMESLWELYFKSYTIQFNDYLKGRSGHMADGVTRREI